MIRKIAFVLFILASASMLFGQTVTPNLNLNTPPIGSLNWGAGQNQNMTLLDGYLSGLRQLPTNFFAGNAATSVKYGFTLLNSGLSSNTTAENVANKDVANGYAGLDSGGKLKVGELPTGLVTSVNSLNGAVTLAGGANVSVSVAGATITFAVTGVVPLAIRASNAAAADELSSNSIVTCPNGAYATGIVQNGNAICTELPTIPPTVAFETNGSTNTSQTVLNLTGGSNIAISNPSGGTASIAVTGTVPAATTSTTATQLVTTPSQCSGSTPIATGIAANGNANCTAAGSGVLLKTNSTNNGSQSTLNLVNGSNLTFTDNGSGSITASVTATPGFTSATITTAVIGNSTVTGQHVTGTTPGCVYGVASGHTGNCTGAGSLGSPDAGTIGGNIIVGSPTTGALFTLTGLTVHATAPNAICTLSPRDANSAGWTLYGLPGDSSGGNLTNEYTVYVSAVGANLVAGIAGAGGSVSTPTGVPTNGDNFIISYHCIGD